MSNLVARQGSRVILTVKQGDSSSVSTTLYLRGQTTNQTLTVSGAFVDGEADLSFTAPSEIDVYDMQINELFTDEDPIKYPDPDCDNCEFPTLTVCEALDVEES